MGDVSDREDLQSYYDAEASLQLRPMIGGWRLGLRAAFVEMLHAEGRHSVVDLGAGPGTDLTFFTEHLTHAVGLDLAIGNARLAAGRSVTVIPADIGQPPLRPRRFAAAWSMSTIMHLDQAEAAHALSAVGGLVESGGPVWIGMWGSADAATRYDDALDGERRVFHRRSIAVNRDLMGAVFDIDAQPQRTFPGHSEYHLFKLRAR